MNKTYLWIGILVLLTAGGGVLYSQQKSTEGVVCTAEAKICSDGSSVGRTGPKCEFAPCPGAKAIIKGQVDVGPICPVQQQGVPCPTPPEAYTSRQIILFAQDGVTEIQRMYFTSTGTYQFTVPAGSYVINIPPEAIGGTRGLPRAITVDAGETLEFDFSIDTGIR